MELAKTLDHAAVTLGVDFIGGFSALVHKGIAKGDQVLFDALPEALAVTERVCASVSVGTTKAGINMDAVRQLGEIIKETAELTKDQIGISAVQSLLCSATLLKIIRLWQELSSVPVKEKLC